MNLSENDQTLQMQLFIYNPRGIYDGNCQNLLQGDKAPTASPLVVSRDYFGPWTRARFPAGGA